MKIALEHLTRSFPGIRAVDDVSLEFTSGRIHALVGENGAGKTTLMRLIYGMLRPDSGKIIVEDRERSFAGSQEAIACRIGMVHQHFMLVDTLSVAENVVLGAEPIKRGGIDREAAREAVRGDSGRIGLEVDPDALVGDLSVGQAQWVEILKVLYRGADFLIFDEPTGVLSPQEARFLFEILRRLRDEGKTIVLITHKLDEVLALADEVHVMRRGGFVGSIGGREADAPTLARMMVGRDVLFRVERPVETLGAPALEVRNLCLPRRRDQHPLSGISFTIRQGEIFGIAGVEGNGQRELAEVITGLRHHTDGEMLLEGEALPPLHPRRARELGVRHVPADRQRTGLVLQMDLKDNLILGEEDSAAVSRWGLFRPAALTSLANERIRSFDVRVSDLEQAVDELSGGNQQKLILARELAHELKVLVAAHPTRGVDVGAIEFVHRELIALRSRGLAQLLFSSELSELLALSDRIGVLYKGRLVTVLNAGETDEEELGLWITGARGEVESA
ncbi:MAG: ABC transporter ATP-binding protein [bacterium]|nr:ABC transporter ATP-binding protein [bacterium]